MKAFIHLFAEGFLVDIHYQIFLGSSTPLFFVVVFFRGEAEIGGGWEVKYR